MTGNNKLSAISAGREAATAMVLYLHQIEYSVDNTTHILATGRPPAFALEPKVRFYAILYRFVGIVGLSVHLRSSTLHQL